MWFDDNEQDASDGFPSVMADGVYVFTLLAGRAALALVVWAIV